ncbi:MAG: ATP-binding protein [Planctomycetota bacterium]|nr:ATP-binding protein [Planctomycetota bacterium]
MPSTPTTSKATSGSPSPGSLRGFALRVLATVFVAELAVMFVLPSIVPPDAHPAVEGLVDALLLSAAVAMVSLPLARSLQRRSEAAESELRRRTEEAERARLELEIYRRAIEHHALVAITDESGRVLQANAQLCEALGKPRESVLGTEGLVLGSGLHPREFWDGMEARIRAGETWQAEVRELGGDARVHHRLTTVVPFEVEGLARRIVVQSDVSEARNAAAHFREMAQRLEKISSQVPGVVYQFRLRVDGSSHFPYASEGIRQIYGVAPAEVREDATPVFGVLHPDDLDRVRARILESARDLTQWRDEYRVVHKDGRVRWVMGSSVPEREADGSILWHGFITDITERRHAQEALERAKDAAERGTRAKSEFLATMSHEIRTPMNGVLGFTHLLLDTRLDDEQREFVRTIEGSGHALLSILDDILDLSKIEAGALVLERTEFEPRRAVEEVSVLLASRAQERGIELVTSVSPEVPERVLGDPGRVRQVLLNLVGNAVKFTERGHVHVDLGAHGLDGGRTELYARITDTGVGMAPEDIPRLFDKFTQADTSTTRRFGGTGLGLAICRQLVQLMGGTLGADSQPGNGSTFWFRVPLPVALAPQHAPAQPLAGQRVVIGHPHALSGSLLARELEHLGAVCDVECDAEGVLTRLAARDSHLRPVGLLVVDPRLALADGTTLGHSLREDERFRALPRIEVAAPGMTARGAPAEPRTGATLLARPLVRRDALRLAVQRALKLETPNTTLPNPVAPLPHARPEPAGPALASVRRVLLVEDNRVNQVVARKLLERMGCIVTVADHGAQAIRLCREQPFDLVLMDCHMPEMDGFEATREIRRAEQSSGLARVRIVALTASVLVEDRRRCEESGMDGVLGKPIQPRELLDALGNPDDAHRRQS